MFSLCLILSKNSRNLEVPFKPHVVNPLSVSSNKGKRRLILDLRYVNDDLEKHIVDSIPGRINDGLLVFGPIIFVNAFHPMIVLIIQVKLLS